MLYYISVEFNKNHIRIDGTDITIGIMAKPKDGAANMEIIKNCKTNESFILMRDNKIRPQNQNKIVHVLDKL